MHFLLVAKQKKVGEAFIGTLRCLAERGHTVTLALQERDEQQTERLGAAFSSSRFSVVACPEVRSDEWADVASLLRRLRDCVQYLHPPLRTAVKLRSRVLNRLRTDLQFEGNLSTLNDALLTVPDDQVRRLDRVLTLAEQRLPTDPLFDTFLREHAPDVLLLSPVVHFGPAQADLIASARRLNLPVWMLLYSWDNLSTKGALHRWPDRMFVWNEQQRREAESLHGFPPNRVVVVGAPRFDEFFGLQPAMTREQFLEPLDLDPKQLTLLYVCSSRFVSEGELTFVRRWVTALRESGLARIQACNIIVRPHPDIALLPPGTTFPRHQWPACPELIARTTRPFEDPRAIVLMTPNDTPRGLFESIVHSDAVVGLNTTAEIEAGIVGRPVFTVLVDSEFADGQGTTVHFHYLRKEHGGFVTTACNLDEHVHQLDAALSCPSDAAAIRSCVESFVRPHGLNRLVSPLYADMLDDAAAERTEPARGASEPDESVAEELRARTTEPTVLQLGDKAMGLHVYLSPLASQRATDGVVTLDSSVVRWIDDHVGVGEVLYEIGAGIGEYAIVAAKRKGAIVIGFEPAYTAHKEFCDNLLLNRCEALVVPVPLALARRDALAEIKYAHGHAGETGYVVVEQRSWRVKHRGPQKPYLQPACLVRLDSFVNHQQAPAPHHIHIGTGVDAASVLDGGRQTLCLPSVKTACVTAALEQTDAIISALGGVGFLLRARNDPPDGSHLIFTRDAT
jgi:FkbM family methyltransferase